LFLLEPNKILFLAPYPFGRVGSQRFRFEQYWDEINAHHEVRFQSFLLDSDFDVLYSHGNTFRKAFGILHGFVRRLFILFSIYNYNIVFIHREATPIGPPIFEWIIAKVFKKKIIYDFDDAIWLTNTSPENGIVSKLKCHWKVGMVCKWAWKITCGNDFLCDFAKQLNPNVVYIPTTLDLDKIVLHKTQNLKPKTFLTIGWTGTHSTLKYLNPILPVLQDLQKEIALNFLLIADKDPKLDLKNYTFIAWNKQTEWQDLAKIDIGIMPLESSEWEEGKCGFKALQYMALNIPAIASPTRANLQIISEGENGFICHTNEEWQTKLKRLLLDESLRKRFVKNGRENIKYHFSKTSWKATYLAILSEH